MVLIPDAENETNAKAALEDINFTFDNFNMQFPQLTYKLIIDFCKGSVEKFSAEYQNLKNFNWDQMGATLIVWQQKNILQNPLCNFGVHYNYKPDCDNPPTGPIKKVSNDLLEKVRVENNKNSKSRKANSDMSAKKCMDRRTEKVFNTFSKNKDNLFIDVQKRFYDKTKDLISDSHEKYEKGHDILILAVKT